MGFVNVMFVVQVKPLKPERMIDKKYFYNIFKFLFARIIKLLDKGTLRLLMDNANVSHLKL